MGERSDDLRVRKLSERALKERGTLPLALLLEVAVPLPKLRELTHELGLSPKGFRVEKAPANALAVALAECKEPKDLDRVIALLLTPRVEKPVEREEADAPSVAEAAAATAAAQKFHEQQTQHLQEELEKARAQGQKVSDRESKLRQSFEAQAEDLQQLRAEVGRLRQRGASTPSPASGDADRELARRVHDLELELDARTAADDALRRQLAFERSRIRELESEVDELEALLPKGRKRKAPPPPPEPEKRVFVPYFRPSFYKSLVGKDRKSIERAVQAVLLFCTEGHAYPGLEVKQLGGQDTWSMRASLGLRVYFVRREDGDIDVVELADREDQHTTLRRIKER